MVWVGVGLEVDLYPYWMKLPSGPSLNSPHAQAPANLTTVREGMGETYVKYVIVLYAETWKGRGESGKEGKRSIFQLNTYLFC